LVPLLNGRVEGYPLDKEVFTPWYYQSFGRASVPPIVTAGSVVWSTDSGHLYVADADDLAVRARLETGSEIAAPAAHRGPYVFVAAVNGEVFGFDEGRGRRLWKYATGYIITRAPAAVGDSIYVTTDEPALHSIDAAKGIAKWEAPNVAQFAAASRNRVYGVDELGALVVLDAASGAMIGRVPVDESTSALVNDQTDRLYLVSDDGMIQCLREIGAKEPLYHQPVVAEPSETPSGTPAATETTQPVPEAQAAPPPDDEDPFRDAPEDVEETMETDEVPAEQPMDDAGFGVEDENPFGIEE
jgi:hypothetical protein